MRASKAVARLQHEVKADDGQLTFGPGRVFESQPPVNSVAPWLIPILIEALDLTMSRKEAAILCGKDEAQFSRQITRGALTWADLEKIGPDFLRNVCDGLRAYFNMFDRAELTAQGDRHMERARFYYAKAAQR
jgi:hypothetical protein